MRLTLNKFDQPVADYIFCPWSKQLNSLQYTASARYDQFQARADIHIRRLLGTNKRLLTE
jgi:hypothetical protein